MQIQEYKPAANSVFLFLTRLHALTCHSFCYMLCFYSLFPFSGMLSVRLYVSVSSIWANTPVICSSHRPCNASLSPSNSPNACGRLLPFRQDSWFLPVWNEVTFMCDVCLRGPPAPSLLLSLPPFSTVGVQHAGAALLSKSIGTNSCSLYPPTAMALWNREDLKEWNHSDWSLDVL